MNHHPRFKVFCCVAAGVVASCSGTNSTSPTAPSALGNQPIAAAQETSVHLRGFMMDTAFRPLAGARVEVLDGPSAGATAISDDDGQFALSGAFSATTQFRAVKDGHESRTQPWNCSVAVCLGPTNAQPWLGFYLSVLEPAANIAGDYTMTFSADSACAGDLPEIARSRSYRVAVTAQSAEGRPTVPGFDVKVLGASMVGSLTGFPIGVAGSRASLWLHGRHDPAIVEDLGGNTYLAFSGTANASVADNSTTITTTFDGWIEHAALVSPLGQWYFPLPGALSKSTCDSSNHRITLTRTN